MVLDKIIFYEPRNCRYRSCSDFKISYREYINLELERGN